MAIQLYKKVGYTSLLALLFSIYNTNATPVEHQTHLDEDPKADSASTSTSLVLYSPNKNICITKNDMNTREDYVFGIGSKIFHVSKDFVGKIVKSLIPESPFTELQFHADETLKSNETDSRDPLDNSSSLLSLLCNRFKYCETYIMYDFRKVNGCTEAIPVFKGSWLPVENID